MYSVIRYTLLNTKELKYDTYALRQYIMHFLCFVVVHFAYFVALLLQTLYALYITQYTSSQQQNAPM